jgi:hypothetical protein
LRIERQPDLQALQRVDHEHADAVEQQDRERIAQPVHVGRGIDPAGTVERTFQARGKAETSLEDCGDVAAERDRQRRQHDEVDGEQDPGVRGHENFSGVRSAATR